MISKVEVRTVSGLLLTLELENTEDGLIVSNIDGLDPVKAVLVSTSFATLDGAQFQSSRRETRNILITLGLEPDYVTTSVRDLRNQLYQFFMPKSSVNLRFFLEDELEVVIDGVVESFESVLFTATPQVVISLICYDPDFVDPEPYGIDGETVEDTEEILIQYKGNVETGVLFIFEPERDFEEFTIYHRYGDVVKTFDFSGDVTEDDLLMIDSVPGRKSVMRNRDSVLTSLLYAKSPQSPWIELQPGDNYIRVYSVGDPVPYTIEYTDRYGGL